MKRPALVLSLLLFSGVALADTWPQLRGANSQGQSSATGLPIEWSELKNFGWKVSTEGRGYSSPVIHGDQIWLTTAIEHPLTEAEAKARKAAEKKNQPQVYLSKVELRALAYHVKDGRPLANILLLEIENPAGVHVQNSYASPTPVIEEGRLYCHFGTFGTAAVDTVKKEVLWTDKKHPIEHENGPGSSPILHEDLLIVHCDGSDQQYVLALDKNTGAERWKTTRSGEMHGNKEFKKAYAGPILAERGGRTELISPGADWLYGYDANTGKELWKVAYGGLGFSNVSSPILGKDRIYVSSGFMKAKLLAVRYVAGSDPTVEWEYTKNVPVTPGPLLVGDELYLIADKGGLVTCLDAKTGEAHWRERIPASQSTASPLYADGRLYFHDLRGKTIVVEPSTEGPKVVSENQLDGQINASMAVTGQSLILRTDRVLYSLKQK